ncbi:MAG: exopolysaccharide biosynthesis polyprenyl glycosylphosphotransferase [Caulobacterales bacterium]
MPLALQRHSEPSQRETPAQVSRAAESAAGTGPRAQTASPAARERRGPLRPIALAPTRSRLRGWTLGMIFRIGDVAAIAMLALIAGAVSALRMDAPLSLGVLSPFALAGLILAWSLAVTRSYGLGQAEGLARHLVRVSAAFGVSSLLLGMLVVGFRPMDVPVESLGFWFFGGFSTLYALHIVWWATVRRWRGLGRLTPNIVVVGATPNAEWLITAALNSREVAVLGVFDDRAARNPSEVAGVPVLGDTTDLLSHRIIPYVDHVVIAVSSLAQARVRQLVERLSVLPNDIMLFVDQGAAGRAAALSRIADASLAPVSGTPGDERKALVKRAEDLVVGTLALIAGAPLMLAVAVAIKLDSPGPVTFRQRRHGFNNEQILVWKFRSMRHDQADVAGVRQVTADDPRVTRVGRFIRRTSLDELPQLLNVLAGEMSLVGPRPHAVGMKTGSTESAKLVAGYAHRHRLKPGITGWAAINGSRGPVDTPDLVRRRVALDTEYIERQSLWLDLYIMLMTIPRMLGDRGAVR